MAEEQEHNETNDGLDIGTTVKRIVSHWYLFVLIVPLFLAIGIWKVRFADRTYETQAQLLIRDSDNKMQGPENLLEGLQMFSAFANIENEIGVIKSTNIIHETLLNLDFDITYFSKGKVRTIERYHQFPVMVEMDTSHVQLLKASFFITRIDDQSFKLKVTAKDFKTYHFGREEESPRIAEELAFEGAFFYGEPIIHDYFGFVVNKDLEYFESYPEARLYFKFNNRLEQVIKYKGKTQVKPLNKTASIIVVGVTETNREKALAFVNAVCDTYIRCGLEDKNRMASNTIRFIDRQLGMIGDSLDVAEAQLESFRSTERVMNIDFASGKAFDNLEGFQKEKATLLTEQRYYQYLLDYVTKTAVLDTLVAPSLIGINDPLLTSLLKEMTSLGKEKAGLQFNAEGKNPAMRKVNNKIEKTRNTLIENVNGLISSGEIRLGELEKSIGQTMAQVNRLPKNERDLINIERKFQLNDQLFKYLQEKRAEAAIALASNIADNKVLDYAQLIGNGPSSPNAGFTYVLFAIFGIIIPVAIVVLKGAVQNKITSESHLKRSLKIPYLGAVAPNKSGEDLPLLRGPKTQIAESIRTMRTNLQYKISEGEDKVIGISSAIMGEGKSFLAANLALSFAMAGYRTVVIGGDLRKPMLFNYLRRSNNLGLTTYLNGRASLEDVLLETEHDHLHMIAAGPASQYPAEMLGSDRMAELMNQLRTYFDYIVIDSPPLRVVADYFVISKYTDVNLVVMRNGFTKMKYVKELNDLWGRKRLPAMFAILNAFSEASVSFKATTTGYYEYTRRQSLFSKIFNRLRLWT
ncbi:MAG: polysaccharide biosynthesis tyrosine autokinase [Flavobacteriales bacterium]|nr:polysaccharide biosynthesis tyrosine autokinase [Flavobacteriales bacterium]